MIQNVESAPCCQSKSRYVYVDAITESDAITMTSATKIAQPLIQPIQGPKARVAQDSRHLVELSLRRDERRRDLDHGVAAIVGSADEAFLEQSVREETSKQLLALLVGERLARLLVLHELDRVEEPSPPQVADDREVDELRERRAEGVLVRENVLVDPLPLHDLDVLERN